MGVAHQKDLNKIRLRLLSQADRQSINAMLRLGAAVGETPTTPKLVSCEFKVGKKPYGAVVTDAHYKLLKTVSSEKALKALLIRLLDKTNASIARCLKLLNDSLTSALQGKRDAARMGACVFDGEGGAQECESPRTEAQCNTYPNGVFAPGESCKDIKPRNDY